MREKIGEGKGSSKPESRVNCIKCTLICSNIILWVRTLIFVCVSVKILIQKFLKKYFHTPKKLLLLTALINIL